MNVMLNGNVRPLAMFAWRTLIKILTGGTAP